MCVCLCVCVHHIYIYILPLINPFFCPWTLDCFHVLAIANSATVNIEKMHSSFQIMVFFRYTPSSGIAGSYGSSFFIL